MTSSSWTSPARGVVEPGGRNVARRIAQGYEFAGAARAGGAGGAASGDEQRLADRLARLDRRVRVGGVGERVPLPDDRPERAGARPRRARARSARAAAAGARRAAAQQRDAVVGGDRRRTRRWPCRSSRSARPRARARRPRARSSPPTPSKTTSTGPASRDQPAPRVVDRGRAPRLRASLALRSPPTAATTRAPAPARELDEQAADAAGRGLDEHGLARARRRAASNSASAVRPSASSATASASARPCRHVDEQLARRRRRAARSRRARRSSSRRAARAAPRRRRRRPRRRSPPTPLPSTTGSSGAIDGCGGRPARSCVSTNVTLASSTSTTTWPGAGERVGALLGDEVRGRAELAQDGGEHQPASGRIRWTSPNSCQR